MKERGTWQLSELWSGISALLLSIWIEPIVLSTFCCTLNPFACSPKLLDEWVPDAVSKPIRAPRRVVNIHSLDGTIHWTIGSWSISGKAGCAIEWEKAKGKGIEGDREGEKKKEVNKVGLKEKKSKREREGGGERP